MFKKLLSITLAALMVLSFAAVFTGCGSDNSSSSSSGESSGKSAESLKFGFIYLHDENSTYDNNFLTAAKEACEKMGVGKLTFITAFTQIFCGKKSVIIRVKKSVVGFAFFVA